MTMESSSATEPWRQLGMAVVRATITDYVKLYRKKQKLLKTLDGMKTEEARNPVMEQIANVSRKMRMCERLFRSKWYGYICPDYDSSRLPELLEPIIGTMNIRLYMRHTRKDGDERVTGDNYKSYKERKKRTDTNWGKYI